METIKAAIRNGVENAPFFSFPFIYLFIFYIRTFELVTIPKQTGYEFYVPVQMKYENLNYFLPLPN